MSNSWVSGKRTYLVLEDGSHYAGQAFGADTAAYGEVVFNTSMTGYQEILTDPSYAGQLVTLTYPLVGNYGINNQDMESRRVQVGGLIVREHCDLPSHGASDSTLHEFLLRQGVPGLAGVDTRAITRRLRTQGVMMGIISHDSPQAAAARLAEVRRYDDVDYVSSVTTEQRYSWDGPGTEVGGNPKHRILVTDYGLKYNILRLLKARGCEVIALPATTPVEDMLALEPSGVVLSPGPGDPQTVHYVVENVKRLLGRVPIMGICLGHQIAARALGADTYKLKFGHRGGNHPVKDLATGRVYITAQNHGYSVDAASLPPGLSISHINLNDDTIEGLQHQEIPLFTIQYHSEGSPVP